MGQGSRRRRRSRRGGRRAQQQVAPPPRGRGIKATIDSYGGFLTIGAIVLGVVVVAALIWFNRPGGVSDDALLGEAIEIGSAIHVQTLEEMEIIAGQPPSGGPHFPVPLQPGINEVAVSDGNAVHALEHGMIWISYNPELASEADIEGLRAIAEDFDNDVVLSPRPANDSVIAAASWGRLLQLDGLDDELLRDFVTTNRDRSPEPGIRSGGIMPRGSDE